MQGARQQLKAGAATEESLGDWPAAAPASHQQESRQVQVLPCWYVWLGIPIPRNICSSLSLERGTRLKDLQPQAY